jgi:preprotein translocase subunit YajC
MTSERREAMNELTHEGLLFFAVLALAFVSVYGVVEWLLERGDRRRMEQHRKEFDYLYDPDKVSRVLLITDDDEEV